MRHDIRSRLRLALGPSARTLDHGGAPLEVALPAREAGRVQSCGLLAEPTMRAHAVGPPSAPGFGAFVDGVQESHAVAFAGVIPIVHARVGAVVRARVNRRLVTWGDGPLLGEALYVPLSLVGDAVVRALGDCGCAVVDTSDDAIQGEETHPQQVLRRAVHLVQRQRETLERELAERWCRAPSGAGPATLYIDGGLPSPNVVLSTHLAVGVVKSHHTLYVSGPALATVMSLGAGERSSLFVVETRWRAPVASWYLRVRDPRGRDPFWGLVRVEASLPMLTEQAASADERADEISRWVLAEAAPLSLPDSRWDTMAYGIRDCEVFLRAALGSRSA